MVQWSAACRRQYGADGDAAVDGDDKVADDAAATASSSTNNIQSPHTSSEIY
jgi:hypothetical protein